MSKAKVHMRRVIRAGFEVAKCSFNRRPDNARFTDDEAEVTCKQCVAAIAFDRECEAHWQRRRAEEDKRRADYMAAAVKAGLRFGDFDPKGGAR